MSLFDEHAIVFDCQGLQLLGIASVPTTQAMHDTGVVVLVGGPQYRIGSHRQFTLLCRYLAEQGIAAFRFDYHGIGDAAGPPALGVDGVEADLRAAIDAFLRIVPGIKGVVLWGLCGAASASALYAPTDARVNGLVLLNPWVRTEAGLAKARLRHYYMGRLGDPAFWGRIARGDVALAAGLRSFGASVMKAAGWSGRMRDPGAKEIEGTGTVDAASSTLPARMLSSLLSADIPALVILSGDSDLTANEFRQVAGGSADWRRWMASSKVERHDVEGSNHTFARSDWRDRVAELTRRWVKAR